MQIPFGEWLPDQPPHLNPGANTAKNVYYAINSYKPFPSLVAYSADSGGASVGVANLTLPGDFAFQTFTAEISTNFLNTSQQSMEPRDPSLQNRRRQATCLVNPVTVEIS